MAVELAVVNEPPAETPELSTQQGDNSPEQVALKLLFIVAEAEGQPLVPGAGKAMASRGWILDTYAECLFAVKDKRQWQRPGSR